MKFEYALSRIDEAAQWLLDVIDGCGARVVAFDAPMGAGKTTLISAMCAELGVEDIPSSPTFAIVNVYRTEGGEYVNHFDFYRAQKIEEAYDIGFEEYLDSGDLCLVEWPGLVEDLLPSDTVRVSITELKENARRLDVTLPESKTPSPKR